MVRNIVIDGEREVCGKKRKVFEAGAGHVCVFILFAPASSNRKCHITPEGWNFVLSFDVFLPLSCTMNWTGGQLQRGSNRSGLLTKAQKRNFARSRSNAKGTAVPPPSPFRNFPDSGPWKGLSTSDRGDGGADTAGHLSVE
jgi:hypothetical protein